METVNKRLFEFLEHYKDLKQKDIQRIFNLKQNANLSAWMNDKIDVPDKYILQIIHQFPDLNANWLINGTGEMLNVPSGNSQSAQLWNPPLSLNDDNMSVKTYSCPDCIWREKLIKSQEETIDSLRELVELQKRGDKKNCNENDLAENGKAV